LEILATLWVFWQVPSMAARCNIFRMPAFPGFSPKAIRFLKQLRQNNTREWFVPRKEQFDELLRKPMLELSTLIVHQLRTFAVDHVIDPARAINRIYRDVRFSKDKSPYKSNISAIYPRKGMGKTAGAGYYFSISGDAVELAGGIYMPGPPELAALRKEIGDHPAQCRKVLENPKMTRLVGPLQGEQLTRPPKGYPIDHSAVDLLRRRQLYYFSAMPAAIATQSGLDKLIVKQFRAMAPAVEYLNGIVASMTQGDDEESSKPLRPEPMF
jgi:uncharacterized protein (TIGR02453 family)